ECCFARFVQNYFTAASLSHYAVSNIDGSSQSQTYESSNLLVARTTVQECRLVRFTIYITAANPSHYAISSIGGFSQSQLCDLQPRVVAWRPNSSNFILSTFLEVKLELEIHLVSSVSFVGFKVNCACFSIISNQIGLHCPNVTYGSGASHLKFLPVNIPTYRCINVDFDYQLFFQTIVMGTKVKLLFGFLHFAEHDSPLNGSIFTYFVMFSSFILPSSMTPGSSALVVNFYAL
ncbi:unnamed protein product, partial [Brassica rapa subsp. trilocularis]